ncbi:MULTISPECIES: Smr/MutS family protein [unclassified Flavobacterium]|uniref:Smr/MutS family protein n=1 Tax=unclassified Flavobacterium TaxID=196869 RepID=UPI001F12A804|nr:MULTISPECIES: Smr/MutS family protein [unclassified Flavobacterium]UMY65233.1 Smr/MutS family protein [Flavobacterium sp. HJ-32-4]
MTRFSKGDRVSVLNDDVDGVVVSVSGRDVTIETTDGFPMILDEKELIPVAGELKIEIGSVGRILKEKEPERRKAVVREKRTGDIPPPEFDLHIEKLVKNHRILSPHDILTMQTETAKRHIEFAIRNRMPRIVLIHGVGDGILRSELEFLLSRYDNVRFHDGNYQKYGSGALEVVFTQK